MGITKQIKFLNTFVVLLLSIMITSCLPVQKKTQCGENEAFNATRRQCVPVLGASTSNTIFVQSKTPANSYTTSVSSSSTAHSIAVSDSYNYGYTVKWFLHYQDTNTNTTITYTVSTNTTYTFNPSSQQAGQYVLEAIVYDETGANQLDSTTWSITNSSLASPTFINPIPNASAYSYQDNSTSEQLKATLSNPDGVSTKYTILVDGVVTFGPATTTLNNLIITAVINPSTMVNGLHTVEIKAVDSTNASNIFDTNVWIVNIVDPDLPIIQPTASNPPLGDTITVVDGVNFSTGATTGGWLNELSTPINTASTYDLCVQVDDSTKDAVAGSDIYVKFSVAGNDIGTATESTPNRFCLTDAQVNAAQSYFNLSNPDVAESRSLKVTTYRTGTTTQVETMQWNVAIRPKNIRPQISIDYSTPFSAGCTQVSTVEANTCTITQSLNADRDTEVAPYNYTDTTPDADIDNAGILGLVIDYDPDITADTHYSVNFRFKKSTDTSWQNIDSSSSYTDTNCVYTSATAASQTPAVANKLQCTLRFDAFGDNGNLPHGDYEVEAYITDTGAGAGTTWGGLSKTSNTVKWYVNVKEQQVANALDIGTFSATPALGNSWIQTVPTCNILNAVPLSVTENQSITICTAVKDLERDNFTISSELTNAVNGGGYSQLSPTVLVTKTDDSLWSIVETTVSIPEWAVTTGSAATLKINVTDKPSDLVTPTTPNSAEETIALTITNNNPPPIITPNTSVDLTGHIAFAGMPYTITVDSATFSDASLYDGTNITWQWLVSTNAGTTWTAIQNADGTNQANPTLVWTPDGEITDGSQISFRLCLGDDGVGNNVANCANAIDGSGLTGPVASSVKQWDNLTVYNNNKVQSSPTASSGNELAQWYDATNLNNYTVYTTGTNIYVEKSKFNGTTGAFEYVHSISFPSEDNFAGKVPVSITDLSATGIDGEALLIAYGLVENTTSTPQFRVRRLDISRDKLNFSYCGFYTDGDNFSAPHDVLCTDLYDDAQSDLEADTNVSYASLNSGSLDITFAALPTTSFSFALKTSAGDTVVYRYGAVNDFGTTPKVVGYCNPGCADVNTTGQALADAIMNTGGITEAEVVQIANEIYASNAGGVVSLRGPHEFDYYDNEIRITPYIGRINVKSSGSWYLPYANGSSSLQLGVAIGNQVLSLPAGSGLGSDTPSHTTLASSGINNLEMDNIIVNTNSLYIATRNNNSNLSMYLVDISGAPSITTSVHDVYSLSTYNRIENITVSRGNTDYIYVSSISVGNSGSTRDLGAAIFYSDLTTYKGNDNLVATGFEQYVQNIDQASIIADPNTKGKVNIALTTNATNANANKAYLIEALFTLGVAGNSSDLSTANNFNFTEYTYPALNKTYPIVANSKIASTNATSVTKGYTNTASVAQDLTRLISIIGFHESNSGNKIRTGFYNTQKESIQTTDTTTSGNYPAFIGN